jgi:hypothetical protein
MFENWYVMYCLMQARQRELLQEAARARAAATPKTATRVYHHRRPRGILTRLGLALIRLENRHLLSQSKSCKPMA